MIPIRDTIPSRNYPVINVLLIAVNIFFYLVEMSQGEALNRFIYTYGLVPARYSIHKIAMHFSLSQQLLSPISYMFLHGSFWHLLGNMWFLYIFGDNVEDRLGHLRYLFFYLLCGISSAFTHLFFNLDSMMPTIGASGAIAGVMGAYFVLYPRSRIVTLIPIIFIPYFVELPAAIFLGIWLFMQFISATLISTEAGNIAWWAHIGGFIFGALFLKLFLLMPEQGISRKLSQATVRRDTPRLHITRPVSQMGDSDLYADLSITKEEAARGVKKLISIPIGYQKKPLVLNIPSGTANGTRLRLAGMGRKTDNGERSDLYLKINVMED
ncbi:MAG TPA: rhomboid family intramembrane serine protease [Syntrophales bacterium]|nr:rhomboid family intramembrane serine protease [Syntrophales bacterium]